MTKHVADKRSPSQGGRMKQFLRIDREDSGETWSRLAQRPTHAAEGNTRAKEYLRIDRGEEV